MASSKEVYSWSKAYNEIKSKHDQAFVAIDQAISLEEREKPNEAIEKYKEGIRLIDEALNVQVQYPENPDSTWEKACSMIQKIKKTRAEVLTRINCIQNSSTYTTSEASLEGPPSYDEAVATSSSTSSDLPRTYKELATALNELSIDPNQTMEEDVIYTHDRVRIYFIAPSGEVLSTQEPQLLKISMVKGNEPNAPKAILQVGNFVYPLVPGVSPCYRTNYGAFILPNVHADVPGSSIGIILPSDADDEVFDLLENILYGVIQPVTEEGIEAWRRRREEPEDYTSHVSNRIVNGAWNISQRLVRGAQIAGEFFNSTTPKLMNNIPRAEQPAEVPKPLCKSMQIAECATSKAAKVTGVVAEKVGIATTRLGQFLAPHIQKQGTRLLASTTKMTEKEAHDKVKNVLTVAAGAVEAFSTVYRGLETSAAILGNSLKENTVKIVEHKYGHPASTLTGDTFSTVGNVYSIAQNTKILTPKGFVKNTAKGTGKAMVYGPNLSNIHGQQGLSPTELSADGCISSSSIQSSLNDEVITKKD